MIHMETNVGIVVETLKKYQYSPAMVKMNERCFSQLKGFMTKEGIHTFDLSMALQWRDDEATVTEKRPYYWAILRLADVYEHGRVLSSHLTIHGELSDEFKSVLDDFIESISSKGFIESSYRRYREGCSMFFRFCQLQGIYCLNDIGFPAIRDFHAFLVESERHEACEGCTERMLMYLAECRNLQYGLSLYLHYARSERCSSIEDFSPKGKQAIEPFRNAAGTISSRAFCSSIPTFIEGVNAYNYAGNTTHAHFYHLNVIAIFLEQEHLDYCREVADIWASELCVRFFGKTRLKALRHTLDLYDTFISNGYRVPKAVHAPYESTYLGLPDWCKTEIDSYAAARKKEGLKERTVRKQIYMCAKFCGFIVSAGLISFAGLDTEHIKSFNLQDTHDSVAGKNLMNQVIYRFLIHMELHDVIQPGLHDALPCCTAHSEQIVTVLSDSDKARIDDYCSKASTPIELRDVAMFKLGINTALRGVDIISLGIRDIDWKSGCIRIIQNKTGVEHLHPVDNGTLNAVFRYIRDGRSKNAKSDRVFVSSRSPYDPLADSEACRNALRRVGLPTADFHRLRRSYATDSLKGGATFRETAELLGHTGTGAIHKYTLLDDKRMRLCPLSLEETGLGMDGRYSHE